MVCFHHLESEKCRLCVFTIWNLCHSHKIIDKTLRVQEDLECLGTGEGANLQ